MQDRSAGLSSSFVFLPRNFLASETVSVASAGCGRVVAALRVTGAFQIQYVLGHRLPRHHIAMPSYTPTYDRPGDGIGYAITLFVNVGQGCKHGNGLGAACTALAARCLSSASALRTPLELCQTDNSDLPKPPPHTHLRHVQISHTFQHLQVRVRASDVLRSGHTVVSSKLRR